MMMMMMMLTGDDEDQGRPSYLSKLFLHRVLLLIRLANAHRFLLLFPKEKQGRRTGVALIF